MLGSSSTTPHCVLAKGHKRRVLPPVFPLFDMLARTNDRGVQVAKWTVHERLTPPIDTSLLGVFRDVATGRLVHVEGGADVALRVMTSPLEQRVISVMSAPAASQQGWTNSVVLQLPSVSRPVLPVDVDFAVVSPDGSVLFHSREGRRLFENLLVVVEADRALTVALAARRRDHVNLEYHGAPHRAYVTPIPGLPWSLVVLREKFLWRAASFELGLAWLAFSVALLVMYAVLVGLLRLLWPTLSFDWAWPDPGRPWVHLGIVAALSPLVWLLAAELSDGTGNPLGRMLVPSLVALIALALTLLKL
jgi:hypothetical protein